MLESATDEMVCFGAISVLFFFLNYFSHFIEITHLWKQSLFRFYIIINNHKGGIVSSCFRSSIKLYRNKSARDPIHQTLFYEEASSELSSAKSTKYCSLLQYIEDITTADQPIISLCCGTAIIAHQEKLVQFYNE